MVRTLFNLILIVCDYKGDNMHKIQSIFFGLILVLLSCTSEYQPTKLSEEKTKIFSRGLDSLLQIHNIKYNDNATILKYVKYKNQDFERFLKEPRFSVLDSVDISHQAFERGVSLRALYDTLTYQPAVLLVPIGDKGFRLVYNIGNMSLDYIAFVINYKSLDGGYKYTLKTENGSPGSGYAGCGNFYDNSGEKMPLERKVMDVMTLFRISGRSIIDTSYNYSNLLD
jgi:hypothetical protein